MSKNWQVGEKHGDYEVISLTPSTATFRKSDGTEMECPNVFQDKATRGIPEKIRKPKKTSSAQDLDAIIAQAQAKKAKLAALK